MNKQLFLLILLVVAACGSSEKPKKIQDPVLIENLLDKWHAAASENDFDSYFNAMTEDGIFIGTDASEHWTIADFKAYSKPYFDNREAWDFKVLERHVFFHEDGKVAWFDELLETWMGVCRGSGVIVMREEEWKISHYVLSLTIPNDNIQDVQQLNKAQDSVFLDRIKRLN